MPDWDEIIRIHGQVVWHTVYRLLGNHADASDCFQETFLSALNASRRQPIVNWGGFLQRLATARALDRIRRRIRQAGRNGRLANEAHVSSPAPGPVRVAQLHELTEQVRGCLAALPPKQAEAVCLHYLEEWSYHEIGRHMGIAPNAVGSLLQRARTRLRETLVPVAPGHEN